MTRFRTSQPCAWAHPRPTSTAAQRLHTHGRIKPMDDAPRGTGFGLALFAIAVSFLAIWWGLA